MDIYKWVKTLPYCFILLSRYVNLGVFFVAYNGRKDTKQSHNQAAGSPGSVFTTCL